MKKEQPTYALSIDFGTTYTAAATWRDGRATTVTLGEHADAVPSVFYLRDDNVLLVGEAAVRRGISDPSRITREIKRRMGDSVDIVLGGQRITPTSLTAHLIRWVIDLTAEREGGPPDHVTLTHPAAWAAHRQKALNDSAAQAGLSTIGLIPEPVAAATHYASLNRLPVGATIAVYDLGGGTFDTAVLEKTHDAFHLCGLPGGDPNIGGANFDDAIMRLIIQKANLDTTTFDSTDPALEVALTQLKINAVIAKESLSADPLTEIAVMLPDVHRQVQVSRTEFEDLIRAPLINTITALERTIRQASIETTQLCGVLLVGGSSRIPLVAQLIQNTLGVPVLRDIHPKNAVCLGAAIGIAPRLNPLPGLALTGIPTPVHRAAPAAPEPNEPASHLEVDLKAAKLTAPQDRQVNLETASRPRFHITERDEPLVARLDQSQPTTRPQIRFILTVLAAISIIIAVMIITRLR